MALISRHRLELHLALLKVEAAFMEVQHQFNQQHKSSLPLFQRWLDEYSARQATHQSLLALGTDVAGDRMVSVDAMKWDNAIEKTIEAADAHQKAIEDRNDSLMDRWLEERKSRIDAFIEMIEKLLAAPWGADDETILPAPGG